MRKLVYGQGVYTVGKHPATTNSCPTRVYKLWVNILSRCLAGGNEQTRHPTYIGCTLHPDFINFQDFADWCESQIGFDLGYQLDKDILSVGCKVYGPHTCAFVPKALNMLLTHNNSNKGIYPVGVTYHSASKKFHSKISIDGKVKSLGYYHTPDTAYEVYKKAKLADIYRQAELYKETIDPRVYNALVNYKF